jgi:hypothetical protein
MSEIFITTNVHKSHNSSCRLNFIFLRFERKLNFLERFSTYIQIVASMTKRLSEAELFNTHGETHRRTDRQTDMTKKVKGKGRTGSLHIGPLCPTLEKFPSVISRGTPHLPARETSISEGRKLKRI